MKTDTAPAVNMIIVTANNELKRLRSILQAQLDQLDKVIRINELAASEQTLISEPTPEADKAPSFLDSGKPENQINASSN